MINAYNFDELYRTVRLEFRFMLAIKSISYFFFNTFANKITVIVDNQASFGDKMVVVVLSAPGTK